MPIQGKALFLTLESSGMRIGELHFEKGATILDVFASVDGENLAWFRSDLAKDKEICLLKEENGDISTEHDTRLIENLTLKDLEKYDFIISSYLCYPNRSHEYYSIGKLVGLLYKRRKWNKLVCIIAPVMTPISFNLMKRFLTVPVDILRPFPILAKLVRGSASRIFKILTSS
jgi:hypothetical protein